MSSVHAVSHLMSLCCLSVQAEKAERDWQLKLAKKKQDEDAEEQRLAKQEEEMQKKLGPASAGAAESMVRGWGWCVCYVHLCAKEAEGLVV